MLLATLIFEVKYIACVILKEFVIYSYLIPILGNLSVLTYFKP